LPMKGFFINILAFRRQLLRSGGSWTQNDLFAYKIEVNDATIPAFFNPAKSTIVLKTPQTL